ncbi:MAG: orotidine-5'-phosphate decarboxylase [Acidobacteriota bacterium]
MKSFADRVVARVRELGHPLCVGLDPHLGRIPPLFRRGSMTPGDEATAAAVEEFLLAIVDRVAGRVAAVKPQIAFFEQLGWRGLRVLDSVIRRARDAGLLIVMDAKRGDIGSTAVGYANAFLGADAPFPSDALTVNPWLGLDTLQPFIDRARQTDSGLFVLVKTSNPGAGDLQDRQLVDGRPVWHALADALAEHAETMVGESGWSSLGVVVGATRPELAREARERLPKSLFLIPGFGAPGASAADAVAGLGGGLEGGLINSSRGVIFPASGESGDRQVWEQAVDEALERAVDQLRKVAE